MIGFLFFVLMAFGYFPEPSKCFVFASEHCRTKAAALFYNLGVCIVIGHRFLGGFIGDLHQKDIFVWEKVGRWANHVRTLVTLLFFSHSLFISLLLVHCSMNGSF